MKSSYVLLSMIMIMLSSMTAFATPGSGKVACRDGKIKAVYSWYRDSSSSLSLTTIFVGDTDRDYLAYHGENAVAGEPIPVETLLGIVTVSLSSNGKSCSIVLK